MIQSITFRNQYNAKHFAAPTALGERSIDDLSVLLSNEITFMECTQILIQRLKETPTATPGDIFRIIDGIFKGQPYIRKVSKTVTNISFAGITVTHSI